MNSKQLGWIKQKQREYFDLFGEKLNIDFSIGLGFTRREKTVLTHTIFNELIEKYSPNLEVIRGKRLRLHHESRENERNFVEEFSIKILRGKLNVAEAAKLLNKDRSNIYHYAGKRNVLRS